MYRLVGIMLLVACRSEGNVQPKPPGDEPGDPTTTTPPPPSEHVVVINEVMAGNQSTVNGPDGTSFPDWIELMNVGESTVPLSDLVLRNSDGARWTGPEDQVLAPGDRVVIWASEEDVGDGLVADFALDKDGDKLTLLDLSDQVLDFLDLEEVSTDISYARTPDATGELVMTAWPTPGAVNPEAVSPTLNPADETVFQPYVMHRIDFTFTPEAYDNINLSSRPEVHVEVDIDGVHYGDVGLKLKGSASYQTMDGKPAFIVDFNEWVEGTKFRDLKALKLHNGLVLDPTRNRDWLSYKLARTAGLMAPRVGWAEVYCNDQYYGLYIVIEKHDDVFIEYRRPGQQDLGVVFEPNESDGSGWGWGDFGQGSVDDWNMEEGPVPPDPAMVESLQAADALIGGQATDARVAELWNHVNKDQFLTFLAWETIIMHTDGYRAPNNWRVYVDGLTHDIELMPSGAEWTWDFDLDAFSYGGRAGSWCLDNEGCTREYAQRLLELADLVETLDLRTEYNDLQTWLNPYIQSDPRYENVWGGGLPQARESTGRHLDENPSRARQQVYQRFPDLQP
jgi:hypothetical protein